MFFKCLLITVALFAFNSSDLYAMIIPHQNFLNNWLNHASDFMFDFRNFERLREKQDELLKLASHFHVKDAEEKHFDYGCSCENYVCKCCTYFKLNQLNDTGLTQFANFYLK